MIIKIWRKIQNPFNFSDCKLMKKVKKFRLNFNNHAKEPYGGIKKPAKRTIVKAE